MLLGKFLRFCPNRCVFSIECYKGCMWIFEKFVLSIERILSYCPKIIYSDSCFIPIKVFTLHRTMYKCCPIPCHFVMFWQYTYNSHSVKLLKYNFFHSRPILFWKSWNNLEKSNKFLKSDMTILSHYISVFLLNCINYTTSINYIILHYT